ncbi:retropepsin-like aspartic protease [Paraburkholderia sp. J76]|uniref:retropepsin-like aspartic protease n=1 Tax=Paraburkholderia sp. J76 TaxID=2805439 RepID=UPI002ABE90CA|nr:retropepsin-like aspartic protease [Paraburkholderia sp. J76]
MSLYTVQNCPGRFVPWSGDFQSYSPDYTPRHLYLMDIRLNGYPVRAVLDTGASQSLLGSEAALRSGVADQVLTQDPKTSGQGIAGTSFAVYRHRFDTLQIGTRVFRNVRVEIGDTGFSRGVGIGALLSDGCRPDYNLCTTAPRDER